MEIVDVQLLELVRPFRRLKEHRTQPRPVVHRTAGIHEHQQLDRVSARALILYLQRARVVTSLADCTFHVKFSLIAQRLVGILAKKAKSHLKLPCVKDIVFTKIPKAALPRNLKRAPVAADAADTDALR